MVADEAAGHWGARLDMLVINAVPQYRLDIVSESEADSWAEVDALVIPESRVMLAPTVAQIAEHLDAAWTLEPVNADALVERFLIGGNIMDNGPTYYGRYGNQAVITRAQRPDIQLASMLSADNAAWCSPAPANPPSTSRPRPASAIYPCCKWPCPPLTPPTPWTV